MLTENVNEYMGSVRNFATYASTGSSVAGGAASIIFLLKGTSTVAANQNFWSAVMGQSGLLYGTSSSGQLLNYSQQATKLFGQSRRLGAAGVGLKITSKVALGFAVTAMAMDTGFAFANSPESGFKRLTRHTVSTGAGFVASAGVSAGLAAIAASTGVGIPVAVIIIVSTGSGIIVSIGVDSYFVQGNLNSPPKSLPG